MYIFLSKCMYELFVKGKEHKAFTLHRMDVK